MRGVSAQSARNSAHRPIRLHRRPLFASAPVVAPDPPAEALVRGGSGDTRGTLFPMCRNIRTLHNFEPPATEDEVRDAALQYVRKISGSTKPSKANEEAFNRAVEEVTAATRTLLGSLVTTAPPKDREVEAEKRRERSRQRFATA